MIERETRDMLVMRPSTRAEREAERAAFIQAEKERRQETSRAQRLARRAARRALGGAIEQVRIIDGEVTEEMVEIVESVP